MAILGVVQAQCLRWERDGKEDAIAAMYEQSVARPLASAEPDDNS
jgi:hypothetical protein